MILSILANRAAFSRFDCILTWKGYPLASYNVNANESVVTVTLPIMG